MLVLRGLLMRCVGGWEGSTKKAGDNGALYIFESELVKTLVCLCKWREVSYAADFCLGVGATLLGGRLSNLFVGLELIVA
jgi:hypothetical protein